MNIYSGLGYYARKIKNVVATNPNSTEVDPYSKNSTILPGAIAPWGHDNQFPKYLDAKIECSIDMESGIQSLTEFCYGQRIVTYIEEMQGNDLIRRHVLDDNFERFRENYNLEEVYYQRALYNFFRYANTFTELSFDESGKKIDRIFTKDAPWCRISTMDKKSGLSGWLYQSSEWDTIPINHNEDTLLSKIKDGKMSRMPIIDYRDPIGFIQKRDKNILLGWHIKDYSSGDPYYGKSSWYPLLKNGWIDIAAAAPGMLLSYYKNLITIARHIEINVGYFEQHIEGWKDLDMTKKKEAMEELQKKIDEHMTGEENAYKSLFSQFRKLPNNEIEHQLIINDVTNPVKDSSIIKDLQYSNAIIQSAMRIDSSLIGGKADGSKEADAGSEKLKAANLLQQRLQMVRNQILYPFTIIKNINGWDSRLKFAIETDIQETTNVAPSGKTSVIA